MNPIDVVVIGDGVIGLAVAWEALRRKKSVAVVASRRSGAATEASGGMLAPLCEADAADRSVTKLGLASCAIYREWVAELERDTKHSCDYRQDGTLILALHHDHRREMEHLAEAQQRVGLHAEWLEAEEVHRRQEGLTPRLIGALWARDDHHVDPIRLRAALRAVVAAKGTVLEADLRAVSPAGDAVNVTLQRGQETQAMTASEVVVATGAWLPEAIPQLQALPLRPLKGQGLRLRHAAAVGQILRTPDVYIVPRRDGELFIGATVEDRGFDSSVTAGAALHLLREAWRVLPGLEEAEFLGQVAGFRPTLRDFVPAIGPTATAHMHTALGHFRGGIMLAPITAKLVLDGIEAGETTPEMAPFLPTRFGAQA